MQIEEPEIITNGDRLDQGEAMLLRVAVTDFVSRMAVPNALGDGRRCRRFTES